MAEEEDKGEKLQAPPDFDGPTSDRSCTDIIFTLLILAMWGGMTFVGGYAITNGDYLLVVGPMDYDGNICGSDYNGTDMTDYPNLYYVNAFGAGVCVEECPSFKNFDTDADPYTLVTYNGIFQPSDFVNKTIISSDFIKVADYSSSDIVRSCTDEQCYSADGPKKAYEESLGMADGNGFAFFATDTDTYLGRCIMTSSAFDELNNITDDALTSNFSDLAGDAYGWFSELFGDLLNAWTIILGMGFGATLVICFGYMYFLRLPGMTEIMVWGSIFLSIASIAGTGALIYFYADEWENADPVVYSDEYILGFRILSFVLFGLAALMFCVICFLRKQIQLAMGCVEEAAGAVKDMPIIVFFPFIQASGLIIFMVVWIAYGVFVAGMGDLEIESVENPLDPNIKLQYKTFEFDDATYQCGWYLLFAFFWTSQFIVAMGQIALAMAFAKWYFTRDRTTIGSSTAVAQICMAFRYHIGTAAFGSLIIAIIQMIRQVISYIQKKAKEADNKVATAVMCCMQCCFCCLEKCMRFLNKNAYVQTALFGNSFCASARDAFFLILRNVARIGAVSYVSSAIIFVGKIFIVSLISLLTYLLLNETMVDELHTVYGPLLLVFFLSYFITDMFLDIFGIGIITILHCFIADEEMFDGDECYARGELKDWVDEHGGW